MNSSAKRQLLILTGLLLVGAFFRLYLLGFCAFSADNMDFYRRAMVNPSIPEVWRHPPWDNQIPFGETLTLLFVNAGLPATPFVTRLPFAIMGIAILPLMWVFVRKHLGERAAIWVVLLAALNPFGLYYSRMAYHYSGAMCWSMAQFLAFWPLWERLRKGEMPPLWRCGVWLVLAAVASHTHMSVWAVVATQGAFLAWAAWAGLRKDFTALLRFGAILVGSGIVLLLVLSRWIMRGLDQVGRDRAGTERLIGASAKNVLPHLLPDYFTGTSILGIALLLGFAALTIVALVARHKQRAFLRSFALVTLVQLIALGIYIVGISKGLAKPTYFSAIWAPLLILLVGGATAGIDLLVKRHRAMRLLWAAPIAAVCLTGPAAWNIDQLEGKPTPYFSINRWVQATLPEGTPIVVDRYLEAWNELAIHNPGNINYTFAVPDEPAEYYKKLNWRGATEAFFDKYPSAALLQVTGDRYAKELGPWTFPDTYFARTAAITNQSAFALRSLGFLYTGPTTLRLAPKIRYNTYDDLVAKARNSGKQVLRTYGAGWGYAKPGWRQGHFESYRILQREAQIELYNVTSNTLSGALVVTGASAKKPKRVTAGTHTKGFAPQRLQSWNIPVSLTPGGNIVSLTSQTDIPLFVADVRWQGQKQ